MTPLEVLQKYFGYLQFRQGQDDVINTVLEGKDSVVIMPTGGGKSLCYQIPALCMEGVTIVISPLIALMKDQVDALVKNNIPATFINSSLSLQEINSRISDIIEGRCKILYIAPERFNDQQFVESLKQVKVNLFAIDEAHCISEWGHDFRPSYKRLKNIIKTLGNPTVVALTATATSEVRRDIVEQLGLTDYELFIKGFDRPNLDFQVEIASKEEKLYKLLEFVKGIGGSGIVYAGTRSNAEEIAEILTFQGIDAINYHGGLSAEDRRRYQEGFMNNDYQVIVATNAFGMGIDKADIRFVCHFDMPGTLEAYYQEAGRAGRDGKDSKCLLLYNPSDRYLQEFFIKGDNPSKESVQEVYEAVCKYDGEPVLMTYSQIKDYVSDSIPEMSIGTALKILERAGYIEMRGDNLKEAYIQFLYNYNDMLEHIGGRAKRKIEVVNIFYDIFSDKILNGVNFNIEEIAKKYAIKKDVIMRALRDLKKAELIDFEPPFRGKEIYIKERLDACDLDVNWSILENKLEKDMEKLKQMEGYIYHQGSKRQYILDYFGEKE